MNRHSANPAGCFRLPGVFFVPLFVLLLCAGLPAQTAGLYRGALPAGYEWIEAPGRSHIPFGMAKGISQQTWAVPHVPDGRVLMVIRAISVRRDSRGAFTNSFQVDCEMGLSSTVTPPANPSPVFSQNRGKDFAMVFTRKKLAFPASAPKGKPSPWLPPIPLDRPFGFFRSKAKGLLWETRVYGASPGSPGQAFTLDSMGPGLSLLPPRGKSGPGCSALSSGKPLALQATVLSKPGGFTFSLTLDNAPPGGPVLLFLGKRSWHFGLIPLPFDLGPLGAPGCRIYVDYLVHLSGKAGNTGRALFKIPMPKGLPRGMSVYAQAYVTAPGINPLGIAVSNGANAMTMGVPQQALVYSETSPTAQSGTVRRLQGTIIALDYL